jgi:ketosteroid isomerase-like protein
MRDTGDTLQELHRIDSEWAAAATAGEDIERIVSFWADDAIVIPPGLLPVTGKGAIRDYVSTSLSIPGFSIGWETSHFAVSEAGDMAYGVGTNRVTFPGESGELRTAEGRAVTVWRKETDGWKCVVDIWNDAPPPS